MYKKIDIHRLYFAAFERGCSRVSTGVVQVDGKSGATYYITKIPETRNRVGVSERDLGVVDVGVYANPIVFAKTLCEAESALAAFLEAEAASANVAIAKMRDGNISRVNENFSDKK